MGSRRARAERCRSTSPSSNGRMMPLAIEELAGNCATVGPAVPDVSGTAGPTLKGRRIRSICGISCSTAQETPMGAPCREIFAFQIFIGPPREQQKSGLVPSQCLIGKRSEKSEGVLPVLHYWRPRATGGLSASACATRTLAASCQWHKSGPRTLAASCQWHTTRPWHMLLAQIALADEREPFF